MSAATLLIAPLVTGWVLSSIIANPIFTAITSWNPHAFEISEKQKIEGAKDIHKAEMRMRMDAAIGRAPPLSYSELQAQLRREAHELVEEAQEKNKHNVLNAVSDSITAFVGFGLLLKDSEGRAILFRTFGRLFGGLSDTAKAFMIIASTDILLGYHSEEGWTAAIRLITAHYGSEVEVSFCPKAKLLQCIAEFVKCAHACSNEANNSDPLRVHVHHGHHCCFCILSLV